MALDMISFKRPEKTIVIYLNTTYDPLFFTGCHEIKVTDKNLLFKYRSRSDEGRVMQAEFFWSMIVGWSHGR